MKDNALIGSVEIVVMDLKSIASDILRYIFEPVEWIRYIAIYFNLPSDCDIWPADKPLIYLQKSFISTSNCLAHPPPKYLRNLTLADKEGAWPAASRVEQLNYSS